MIYGVNLEQYKLDLVILLIGGGALAFVNFLQMIITVTRRQNLLNIGYLTAFIAFLVLGSRIVSVYGIVGISALYTTIVIGIGIIFGILTMSIIRKGNV